MGQTVVVVDDDPGFRSLIGRLLNATGFDVVGDAADGEEALAVTRRLHPDIVLLDVQMPGRDGFSVARQLVRESTSMAVVLTSGRSVEDYGHQITSCEGIAGFLLKDELSGPGLRDLIDGQS
jgi:DNA-binding NarL/FixJ family response regulator